MTVAWWWTGFGGCVIWPLRVVLWWKTVRSAVIAPLYKGKEERYYLVKRGWKNICRDPSRTSL